MPAAPARQVLAVLVAVAAAFSPAAVLAQTSSGAAPLTQPSKTALVTTTSAAAPRATAVKVDRSDVDYGGAHLFGVFGVPRTNVTVFAATLPNRTPMPIRQADLDANGAYVWELRPGGTTTYYAVADAVPTEPVTVRVRRTATIGVQQAGGSYTFAGQALPAKAGLQVTIARLDSVTNLVKGVASARTDAAGRYTIRTRLPSGFAGYHALTEPTGDLLSGRSRLYGLIVTPPPGRASITIKPLTLNDLYVKDLYFFTGMVSGQPGEVPVTLGRLMNGRLAGVRGGLTDSTGGYSLGVALMPGTYFFQVVTATAKSPVCRLVVTVPPSVSRCS